MNNIYSSAQVQQHTLGHHDCPACNELRHMYLSALSADLPFEEAAVLYMRIRQVDATPGAMSSARYIKANTVKYYEAQVRSLNLFFGSMKLTDIHLGHLCSYQRDRIAGKPPFFRRLQPHRKEAASCPVQAKQVNAELGTLKRILRRANAWTNEMEEFFEELLEEEQDVPRSLDPRQQTHWLECARSKERWNLIHWYSVVAFDTTASTNELRALRIGDVNLHHQMISVPWEGAKCRGRHRSISIENADCLWALEQLLYRAREIGSVHPQHYLFPFRRGTTPYDPTRPMTQSGLKKKWEEVRDASGLDWFRPYDTRHTGITRQAEQGVPIQIVMARAGHLSPRMTQHYTHISDAAQRRWLRGPTLPAQPPLDWYPPTQYAPSKQPKPPQSSGVLLFRRHTDRDRRVTR